MAMPDDDGWIRDLASSLDALVRDIERPPGGATRPRHPAAPSPQIAAMSDPRGEADRSGEAPDWPPAVQAEIDAFRFLVAHGAPRPR
ncbi:hypothetical protein [Aureimonas sp. AU12]|uniref:hypothetical protein n=1 Tax=Aureimonas sp. AU12 TaxID=1638161 RepID=UPI000782B4EB|nr:hypothetical protein [Aureimonas sp. AU12]